jgi:hypothetical protein
MCKGEKKAGYHGAILYLSRGTVLCLSRATACERFINMGISNSHENPNQTKNHGGPSPQKRQTFFHKHDGNGGAHKDSQQCVASAIETGVANKKG